MFFDKVKMLVDELDRLFKFYYQICQNDNNENSFVALIIGSEENSISFHLVLNNIDEDFVEINFSPKERSLYEYLSLFYIAHFFDNMNVMVDKEAYELSNNFFYPYFKIINLDDLLWDKIEEIVDAKHQFGFEQIDELLHCQYKEMKFWQRRLSNQFLVDLSQNVAKRKALLLKGEN